MSLCGGRGAFSFGKELTTHGHRRHHQAEGAGQQAPHRDGALPPRHKNGTDVLGVYAITEEVPSILPLEPFVPPLYSVLLQGFDLTTEQVTDWRVSLNRVWEENGEMKADTVGSLAFAE